MKIRHQLINVAKTNNQRRHVSVKFARIIFRQWLIVFAAWIIKAPYGRMAVRGWTTTRSFLFKFISFRFHKRFICRISFGRCTYVPFVRVLPSFENADEMLPMSLQTICEHDYSLNYKSIWKWCYLITYRWLSARLQYLHCLSIGDTAGLH